MTETEWIEEFAGCKLNGADSGKDPNAGVNDAVAEEAFKQKMLADAHRSVGGVKGMFQKAMSNEVKVQGSFFKQKLLDVEGTQLDEAEFEEINFSEIKLSEPTLAVIKQGSNLIMMQGERLASALYKRGGKESALFSAPEIEDGYWFPLTRERILPETYIGALYSKTQRMLDETNELYLAAVEVKREKGELTPKANRPRDLIQSGAELLSIGADLAGGFGQGTENAKLAGDILTMMSKVAEGGGEIYDKLKAREFADASNSILGNMGLITSFVLSQVGMPKEVVTSVQAGFKAGGAAISAGKKFAEGADGAVGGTEILSGVLKSVLTIAANNTDDPNAKSALKLAASTAPNAITQVAIGMDLAKKVKEGDADGVIDCLSRSTKNVLEASQAIRKFEETRGMSEKDKGKVETGIDKQTAEINKGVDIGGTGLKVIVAIEFMTRKGQFLKGLDKLITNIGSGLENVLTQAGVDPKQAAQIGMLYKAASAAPKVLDALAQDPPNVEAAVRELGVGIGTAFKGAAPNNEGLQKAGAGLQQGFNGLAGGIKIVGLFKEGKYDQGMKVFTVTLQTQVSGIFSLTGPSEGGDDGAGEGGDKVEVPKLEAKLEESLKQLIGDLGEAASIAGQEMEKNLANAIEDVVNKEAEAEAVLEAEALLLEAQQDLALVKADKSDAENLAAEASDIDKLIGKMVRDQMIMKIAIQIATGGTAFLASFIPALGAASAAIKMCANMVAAGQRAEQLYFWVESKRDFEAAQNELTSSSKNFVKNQGDQFTHYAVQAAFNAAEMIGNVLEAGGSAAFGAGATVGTALKVTAKAGAKLEEIIQKHKKREELEKAWRVTKSAFKNPTNRKLGLRARALNPTLAKYGIAWGAVKKKDPLARNAVRACNLTEAVLENENSNVDKVVEYLETFYSDDDKLYREVEEAAPWVPTDIQLTLRYWSKFKKLAVDKVKLQNPDTGNIDGLLAEMKVNLGKLDEEAVSKRAQFLRDLDRAFGAYQPNISNAKSLEAFNKVVVILRKQVGTALKDAEERAKEMQKKREENATAAEALKKEQEKLLGDQKQVLEELQNFEETVDAFDGDDEASEMMVTYAMALKFIQDIEKRGKPAEPVAQAITALNGKLKRLDEMITLQDQAA